jgi:hypothetical protein
VSVTSRDYAIAALDHADEIEGAMADCPDAVRAGIIVELAARHVHRTTEGMHNLASGELIDIMVACIRTLVDGKRGIKDPFMRS